MTCHRFGSRAHEVAEQYLAGKLSTPDVEAFEAHYFECDDCSQQLLLLQEARADLATRPLLPPVQRQRIVWWRVLGLACAALLVAIGITTWRIQTERTLQESADIGPAQTSSPVMEAPHTPKGQEPKAQVRDKQTNVQRAQSAKGESHLDSAANEEPTESVAPSGRSPESNFGSTVADSSPVPPASQTPPLSQPKDNGVQDPELAKELFLLGEVDPPAYSFGAYFMPVKPGRSAQDIERSATDQKKIPGPNDNSRNDQSTELEKFRLGMNAYVDRDYRTAEELLLQAESVNPNVPKIPFYLGICQLQLGRPDAAITSLERSAKFGDAALEAPSRYYLAKALIQIGQFARAEDELNRAISLGGRYGIRAKSLLESLQQLKPALNAEH